MIALLMMVSRIAGWFIVAAVLGQALSGPVVRMEGEGRPRAVVADLGQRLASHARFQDAGDPTPRLPIPTPQDFEAIKKVAQILVMLGEQIIPTLIGDCQRPPPHALASGAAALQDIPNDPVDDN